MSLAMEEWVMNSLYSELIGMPLWTLSAFGFLQDGDVIRSSDVRCRLIEYLVVKYMNQCPNNLYNNDYRHDWKLSSYIPLVKQAVKTCRSSFEQS
jgi:hypothetical protein